MPTTERVFQLFKELNQIPRPSHHEERVADYLCQFAERLHLPYKRDKENCVVISKPATPGHEGAEPIVLLNHMDMVCVGMKDPLSDPIEAYVEDGWMKARGTSLGAIEECLDLLHLCSNCILVTTFCGYISWLNHIIQALMLVHVFVFIKQKLAGIHQIISIKF